MAGSLAHIIDPATGLFTADHIENMGDAIEALEECHRIIAAFVTDYFLSDDLERVALIFRLVEIPQPNRLPALNPSSFGKGVPDGDVTQ